MFKDGGNEVIISKASLAPNETWYSSKTSTSLLATGNKGDITVNGNGSWTINTNAVTSTKILDGAVTSSKIALDSVTYAQLQPASFSNRLLGRGSTAGTLDVEEISIGTGLSMSGTTLNNTGVTSVGLSAPSFLTVSGSPVTTSGTLTLALATQTANTVFAGPTTGIAAAPTFRALVAGDIPDLSSIYQPLDADLTAIAALTANGLLRKTAGVWAMDSASYLTTNQTITLSGDVTGSGTTAITATIANDAVTYAKMQNVSADRVLGRRTSIGDPEELTLSQTLDLVGSAAQGDLLYRGASTWTRLAAGTSGRVLQTKGTGANPEWAPAREVLTAARTYFVGFALGSCTITNASPGVVTCTGSNLVAGDPVVFTSSNTLPTQIVAGTVYYVIAAGLTANSFQIATSVGGAAINTTGGSGPHSVHTGNDANPGFGTNGRSVALLTIQRAIDLASNLDSTLYDVTIKVCDGLHLISSTIVAKSMGGAGRIIIEGNTTSPANVIIRTTVNANIFAGAAVSTAYQLTGLNFQTSVAFTGANTAIRAQSFSVSVGLCHFTSGGGTFNNLLLSATGGFIDVNDNLTFAVTGIISSVRAQDNGYLQMAKTGTGVTVTIAGEPATGINFLFATRGGGIGHDGSTKYDGNFAANAAPRKRAEFNGLMFGGLRGAAPQAAFIVDPATGGQIG